MLSIYNPVSCLQQVIRATETLPSNILRHQSMIGNYFGIALSPQYTKTFINYLKL